MINNVDHTALRKVTRNASLAWRAEAFVEIYCKGTPTPAELKQELEKNPEVVEACAISGAANAMVHVLARDISHLEQAIQRIRTSVVIDRTETVIVLSRMINRPGRESAVVE